MFDGTSQELLFLAGNDISSPSELHFIDCTQQSVLWFHGRRSGRYLVVVLARVSDGMGT